MEEVMNQKDSSYEKFLENSPENIEKQLHDKLEELEQSKQEINALKIINAKLLTQLQYERTQKLNTSTNTTLQSPSISSPLSQASSGVNKNKKKKNKNINPEESKLQTQSIDEHFITEDNIINSTVQDLLINLQMENQKLTSDILVLEEEVSKLTNEKQISSIEITQSHIIAEELSQQLELKINENLELSSKIEILSRDAEKWRLEATDTQLTLQNARDSFHSLNENFNQISHSNEEFNQLKEMYDNSVIELEKQQYKILQLNDEIRELADQREKETIKHLEELNHQRKSVEILVKENTQEREHFEEKIRQLELLIASQREELSEKSTQINQLTSQLTDLTLSRNQLEKERNEQIENFSLFKDLATEKETNLSKSLHERIKKLEVALAETEEALLVSQSTAKSYEVQEVKLEYEKKKLLEEISIQTRMREKAEMRLDVEIQKSQLSDKLRKEAMEESQLLSQKCHNYEDELDLLQKQLKDLKKEFRVKFDLVENLQSIKYEQESKIAELLPYVDIAAEVEPLRERVQILQNAQTERDQLQQEVQQLTNELHTLSAAFELRGQTIQEMEKQSDLVQSDLSYLKLDDSIKRNKLNTMQEIINENKKIIEKQDTELKNLRNQLADAHSKIESSKLTEEKLASLQQSYKQSIAAYSELQKQHHETLATIEELSQTAAEEIEKRNLEIDKRNSDIEKKDHEINRLNGLLASKNQVTAEYERLSVAYEKLIHQYSDLMDERSQLFQQYSETRNEIESIKVALME